MPDPVFSKEKLRKTTMHSGNTLKCASMRKGGLDEVSIIFMKSGGINSFTYFMIDRRVFNIDRRK